MYVSIGPMSVTVNVVRVLSVIYGLAAYLIKLWRGPSLSSEYVFAVEVESHYDRRSVGQFVLVSCPSWRK
jgi:hypothetical protein